MTTARSAGRSLQPPSPRGVSGNDDAFTASASTEDGRAARSRRTRRAILDALRSLHVEGDLAPTVAQVAERAGIARRTVWQHFADLESLYVEAGQLDAELVAALTERIDVDQPLEVRIALFTTQRARLFEEMAPSWRAGRLQEPFSEQIRRNRKALVEVAGREVAHLFAPELRAAPARQRAALSAAVQVSSLWAAWESMRTELNLSPAEARQVVARTLTALLVPRP